MLTLRIQLIRSLISVSKTHKLYCKSIGLKKLWSVKALPLNNSTIGILKKVWYLVRQLD